ncbi:MAG: Smr/MutS family protein [Proteobacteria bacterium]|nr:Smr/MutS family protein [Pseudomonadota bacterium]
MAAGDKGPTRPSRRERSVSGEESTLFEYAMRGAERLRKREAEPGPPSAPEAKAKPAPAPAKRNKPGPGAAPARPKPAPAPPADLETGLLPGVDRRTAERFRRGQLPIEAWLDLHGHTRAAARRALLEFIHAAHHAGRRAVLVITGKGARVRQDETGRAALDVGVLYEQVPRWLNGPELRPLVLGFARARARHGGEGALYVLLKRRR